MADRIAILDRGQIVGEFRGEAITAVELVQYMQTVAREGTAAALSDLEPWKGRRMATLAEPTQPSERTLPAPARRARGGLVGWVQRHREFASALVFMLLMFADVCDHQPGCVLEAADLQRDLRFGADFDDPGRVAGVHHRRRRN